MKARKLALILFLLNLNCIWIDSKDRRGLPPALAGRVCPESTHKRDDEKNPEPWLYVTPTRRLAETEYPEFADDLDFTNMEIAIERQLKRYNERRMSGEIKLGNDTYSLRTVADSLKKFQTLIHRYRLCMVADPEKNKVRCFGEFQDAVRGRFAVYVPDLEPGDPRYGEDKPVLFTGYYTPLIYAEPSPVGTYQYPIYAKPTNEWYSRVGRYSIDFRGALKGQGLELFYTPDRFDLYLLHLEGGGRIAYTGPDGNPRSVYLSYAGSNGRKWRFLSAQMLEKNWIPDPSLPTQRKFIQENPELEPEIFSYCPSYVFFKTSTQPPEGSDVVPLTDNRSIATDHALYGFKGMLAFVQARRPKSDTWPVEMIPFSRFVLDQDTGGAIKGKGRVDFYFGEGAYAQFAANTVKQRGDLFYLILKP
jgi:membrane-bound lytic murein transglycosylase A